MTDAEMKYLLDKRTWELDDCTRRAKWAADILASVQSFDHQMEVGKCDGPLPASLSRAISDYLSEIGR